MKKLNFIIAVLALLLFPHFAQAQSQRNPCYTTGAQSNNGMWNCIDVGTATPLPVMPSSPNGNIQGNASGTTGAVVATLAANASRLTYICDFDVSATGTGSVGPITVAGLSGGSKTFQLTAPATFTKSFSPCLPSSAINTAITITTTADATATAVNVNADGYQQ